MSFTDFNFFRRNEVNFVGFQNYLGLLKDPDFNNSLIVTSETSFFSLLFEFSFGLLLAAIMNNIRRGREFYRVVFLIPMMIAPTVVGLLFRFMLNNEFGVVNVLLLTLG